MYISHIDLKMVGVHSLSQLNDIFIKMKMLLCVCEMAYYVLHQSLAIAFSFEREENELK